MGIEKYSTMLHNLLPRGLAWPRQKDTTLTALLEALGVEFQRVDGRVQNMLEEAYPLTASELLTDWERLVGLPEECEGLAETIQRRREAVDNKLSTIGGQSPGYYISVAARLGYEITITEFNPFRVGEDAAGDPLYGEDWAYAWQVNAPEESVKYFAAGEGAAGEPLATWGNSLLECVISRLKPAHTIVIFAYNAPVYEIPDFGPGMRLALAGDSISQSCHYSDLAYTKISNQGDSFVNWAIMQAPGVQFVVYNDPSATAGSAYFSGANHGIQGDYATNLLARTPDIIAQNPDAVLILIGTNEGPTDGLAATVIARIGDMLTAYEAAGIYVILCTIPPREVRTTPTPPEVSPAYMQRILDINAWARTQNGPNVKVIDPFYDMLDPAYEYGVDDEYGSPIAGLLRDEVHLAPKGARIIGNHLQPVLAAMTGTNLWDDTYFESDPADAGNIVLDGILPGSGGTANNGVTGTVPNNYVAGYTVAPTYCSGVASVEANAITGGQNAIFDLSSDGLGGATTFEQFGFSLAGFRINESLLTNEQWVRLFIKVSCSNNEDGVLGALRCQLRNSTTNKYAHGLEHTTGIRQDEPWPTGDIEGWLISEPLQWFTGNVLIPHLYVDMLANIAGDVRVKCEGFIIRPVEDPAVTFP